MYKKTYIHYDAIEREYRHLYGIHPDDDFQSIRKTKDYDTAHKIVNERAYNAWKHLKERLEREAIERLGQQDEDKRIKEKPIIKQWWEKCPF